MIVDFEKYKQEKPNGNTNHLKIEVHDFLGTLSIKWEGVTNICDFIIDLASKNHRLQDILYAIGEDSYLFFWSHRLLSSLSLQDLEQMTETLREAFPKDESVIQDLKLFYVTHQYEKIGLPKKVLSSLLSPSNQEGHA